MPNYQASIIVNLRPSVLDPAGEAARSAAKRLGIDSVKTLRIGKKIDLELEALNEEEARKDVELLSDRLLANPVIENWSFDIHNLDK